MVKNYLRIALRNLRRHKGYSFINLFGLATGMAASVLILLYVHDELSYDRFHEKADRIYRIGLEGVIGGTFAHTASTSAPMAATLAAEFPEVEQAGRFLGSTEAEVLLSHEDRRYYEDGFLWADSTVFEIFSFPFVYGDPATALDAPNTLVLSETLARKYFGEADPLGKVLRFNNEIDFTVTGVMEDLPRTSHLQIKLLASMSTLAWTRNDEWVSNSFLTYFVLREGARLEDVKAKIPGLIRKYVAPQVELFLGQPYDEAVAGGLRWGYFFEPLTDIRLHSTADNDPAEHSDIRYVYILSAVAAFILLIACINFMNLATARSANRAREVGLRKVMGSGRGALIRQFLGESILLSMLSVGIAFVLILTLLPVFNRYSGKPLELDLAGVLAVLGALGGIAVVTGLFAGVYPAFVLSSFQPVAVLKGQVARGAGGVWLRRSLVVVQFGISLVLLVGTGIVFKQLRYMQAQRLGFTEEQVVVLPLERDEAGFEALREDLLANPRIKAVAAGSVIPGRFMDSLNGFHPEGAAQGVTHLLWQGRVSHDYLDVLELDLVAGRPFSRTYGTDDSLACIINEAAVRLLGWTAESAVGKTISELGGPDDGAPVRTVVGVVKDFHYDSLQEPIKPILLNIDANDYDYVMARVQAEDLPATLAFLEQKWEAHEPTYPYRYFFLDDDFRRLYEQEQRLGQIFGGFTLLAIFIACLGLFGLASFVTQQRTKEIGVRKVLGASVGGIVILLATEFTKMVLVAAALAFPAAYFLMNRWLQDFAYRTNIGVGTFVVAGLLAFLIAWVTVSYQSIKAALADPVKSLRYE